VAGVVMQATCMYEGVVRVMRMMIKLMCLGEGDEMR
jgi:hypothetical protein